ncbi:hypothetical protein [uncultured Allofournierella sp.]|uniref:hypothetical protein n=1 Tax=uncultured Allofournierella sp. TaxID=1940258 RepID=UPI0037518B02
MFFHKKINRVVNLKKAEQHLEEELDDVELEKGDRLAMTLAGLIVFLPITLGIMALMCLALYLVFFRFF